MTTQVNGPFPDRLPLPLSEKERAFCGEKVGTSALAQCLLELQWPYPGSGLPGPVPSSCLSQYGSTKHSQESFLQIGSDLWKSPPAAAFVLRPGRYQPIGHSTPSHLWGLPDQQHHPSHCSATLSDETWSGQDPSNLPVLKESQPWVFIGRTDAEAPALRPPDVKRPLIGKDPDVGKDWRQEEKGMTEDVMAGWHHGLNGHEFE